MKINTRNIPRALLLMSIIVFTFGCEQSLPQVITKKIAFFERYENEYFSEISLQVWRNSRNQKTLEYQVRYRNRDGRAFIQTKPKQIIFQNFIEDSILLDFVKVIDTINVRRLSNFDDTTHIEFWYDDEYVVLYKISPIYRKSVFEKKEQFEVFNDWKYFTFKLQPN